MSAFHLDIEKQQTPNGTLIGKLSGKLALETVHDFIETMRHEPADHLILDMSGVSFLDSAGVGALVSLFVSRRNHKRTFALAALTEQGNAVMQVSGLTKLLPIYVTVAEALAASGQALKATP
jgi:anti-sigma B factor antagonist